MKTNLEQVTVKTLGGKTGTSVRFTYTDSEFRGEQLGNGLRGDWEIVRVRTSHIERDSERALLFGSTWVPKSLIESLEFIGDSESGPFEVCAINVPEWFARKNFN